MLFANVCAGFISSFYGDCGKWLCKFAPFCVQGLGHICVPSAGHARPLGEGRWGHYLRFLCGDCWAAHNTATHFYFLFL